MSSVQNLKLLLKKLLPSTAWRVLKRTKSTVRTSKRILKKQITKDSLVKDLRDGGIRTGDVIVVHSALSGIGNVLGGPDAVIDALMAALGPTGTILMPAFDNAIDVLADSKRGVFRDLRVSPSKTGAISETFRKRPGVLRSSHPFASVCAWGQHAQLIASNHEDFPRMWHEKSPLTKLIPLRGKIVGIGSVSMSRATFYHVVEDTWPDYPLKPCLEPELCTYIDALGKSVTRPLHRHDPEVAKTRLETDTGAWVREYLEKHFVKTGIMKQFQFGDGGAWWMDAARLNDELQTLAKAGITIYTTKEQGEKIT